VAGIVSRASRQHAARQTKRFSRTARVLRRGRRPDGPAARETQRLWSGSCRSAAVSMLDAFRHVFKALAAPQFGRTLANQVRLERLPKLACCPIYEDMM
jgi:hypothetical protein